MSLVRSGSCLSYRPAVSTATCLCAAVGSILMGSLANYPLALAPGMGLNAYFTYTVVKGMGIPWQTALGAVFLSGILFLLLTLGGIRQRLLAAIPYHLHAAVAGGIGLFIAFIGLLNSRYCYHHRHIQLSQRSARRPSLRIWKHSLAM